jgi:hypothetical protein
MLSFLEGCSALLIGWLNSGKFVKASAWSLGLPRLAGAQPDNSFNHIYRRGGTELMVQLTKNAGGYAGTYNVGFLIT